MNPFDPLFPTPSGVWNPVVWIVAFIIALAVAYAIYIRGSSRRKGGMQEDVFFSGDLPPEGHGAHVKAHNIGWGFMEVMKPYYSAMRKMHTGIVNDYVGWFLGVIALMLILFLLWGGAP